MTVIFHILIKHSRCMTTVLDYREEARIFSYKTTLTIHLQWKLKNGIFV